MKGEITAVEHWEEVRRVLNISINEFSQIPLEFWAGDTLDEDLIIYLRNLRPDCKTALLSNAWDNLRQQIEEIWKIDDAFDHILISAEVGMIKPDRPIFERLLSDLGVKPAEAVFVDDFPQNVAAAKEVGLEAIHFRGPNQALDALQKLLDGK
jgi:putative hydrolase of the HAD superfamily